MKVYIAARYSDKQKADDLRLDLVECGFEVTSRWHQVEHRVEDEELEGEKAVVFASEDLADVDKADAVVVLSSPLRTATRGGKHFEAGYAYALGKAVVVYGEREHIFHRLCFYAEGMQDLVDTLSMVEEFLDAVRVVSAQS